MTRNALLMFVVLSAGVPAAVAAPAPPTPDAPPPHTAAPTVAGWPQTLVDAMLASATRPGDAFDDLLLARALRSLHPVGADTAPRPANSEALEAAATALERRALATATGDWRAMALLLSDPRHLSFDAQAMADALAAAQPDNAYVHLLLMAREWRADAPARFVAAADRAATAKRFRAVFPLAAEALRRRIGRDDIDALVFSTGVAAATTLPAYQNVVTPCRDATGTIAAACLALGETMVREGDTVIDIGIGAALVEALGSDEQRAAAIARRDAVRALFEATMPAMAAMERDAAAMGRWMAASAELGEIGALEVFVAERGIAPTHGVEAN